MVRSREKKSRSSAASGESSGVELFVAAQQSRYVDSLETPTSRTIEIKDLSISVGQKDILAHAELQLQEGVHYVLYGRNGVGKSTLLRALGEGRIPGVPTSLRVLLLAQTHATTTGAAIGLDDNNRCGQETVIEHVVRSDTVRERLLRESQLLANAFEDQENPFVVVRVLRMLKHEQLKRELAVARETAARRSGTRGIKARKELKLLETRLAGLEERLKETDDEVDPASVSEEVQEAAFLQSELEASLDTIEASTAEARAESILLGLGFLPSSLHQSYSTLSGGWQMRCSLARILFLPADVLLLDEPTNFLDLSAVIWLQDYIQTRLSSTTVVVVTHDWDFADSIADEVLILRASTCTLERFRGNLSAYNSERAAQQRRFTRMKSALDRQRTHMSETIRQNEQAAKRTGDDNKLRQAASRRKKLEERTGLEIGRNGGRFKLNRDRVGFHNSAREEITVPQDEALVRIVLFSVPPPLRFPGALVALENVSFSYKTKTEPVLKGVTFSIHPGDRVGIVGVNGSGKSTLVSLIAACEEGSLSPTGGTITRHSQLQIKCFSQNAVEELDSIGLGEDINPPTALSILLADANGQLTEAEARAVLSALGLQGKTASHVPVTSLSGGQKVRLALAKLVYAPPHLLILDEVTTHLDTDTILSLACALRDFQTAVLVITHDRFFMRCVVEGQKPYLDTSDSEEENNKSLKDGQQRKGVVYRLTKGRLRPLDGGMQQYEELAVKAAAKLRALQ